MCEPVTMAIAATTATQAIMGGLAATSAAVGAYGARAAGQAQADAIGEQRQLQSDQIQDAAEVKIGERVKNARAERSRLRVSAGEAGVSGNSFASQLMDSAFQENEDITNISINTSNAQNASQATANAALTKTEQPSALATGLQIVSSGVTAGISARP